MIRRDVTTTGGRAWLIRRVRGFTSTALGKALKLSQAQVSRLETDTQGLRSRVIERLAKVLKVHPAVFFLDRATAQAILKTPAARKLPGVEIIANPPEKLPKPRKRRARSRRARGSR